MFNDPPCKVAREELVDSAVQKAGVIAVICNLLYYETVTTKLALIWNQNLITVNCRVELCTRLGKLTVIEQEFIIISTLQRPFV